MDSIVIVEFIHEKTVLVCNISNAHINDGSNSNVIKKTKQIIYAAMYVIYADMLCVYTCYWWLNCVVWLYSPGVTSLTIKSTNHPPSLSILICSRFKCIIPVSTIYPSLFHYVMVAQIVILDENKSVKSATWK